MVNVYMEAQTTCAVTIAGGQSHSVRGFIMCNLVSCYRPPARLALTNVFLFFNFLNAQQFQ